MDHRADLYGIGVVLYQLLTGRLPFQADDPMAVMYLHVHQAPPAPRALDPGLSADWEPVLLRALAKRPEDRYPSAAMMAAAIQRAALGAPAGPGGDGLPRGSPQGAWRCCWPCCS